MLHHFSDSFSCAINPCDVITAVPTAAVLQSYKLTLSFHIWSTSLFPWFKQACTESSFQFRLKSFQVLIRDGNRDPQYVIICVPVALWQQAECYGFDSQGSHIRGLLQCLARQKRLILKAPSVYSTSGTCICAWRFCLTLVFLCLLCLFSYGQREECFWKCREVLRDLTVEKCLAVLPPTPPRPASSWDPLKSRISTPGCLVLVFLGGMGLQQIVRQEHFMNTLKEKYEFPRKEMGNLFGACFIISESKALYWIVTKKSFLTSLWQIFVNRLHSKERSVKVSEHFVNVVF